MNIILRTELDRARFIRRLLRSPLKDEAGNRLQVRVSRAKPRRSLNQNALFHAWAHLLAIHAGSTDAEMKADLKRALLPVAERVDAITGEVIEDLASTARLSKADMAEFLTRVEALATDHFEVVLPKPNDPEGRQFILELLQDAA